MVSHLPSTRKDSHPDPNQSIQTNPNHQGFPQYPPVVRVNVRGTRRKIFRSPRHHSQPRTRRTDSASAPVVNDSCAMPFPWMRGKGEPKGRGSEAAHKQLTPLLAGAQRGRRACRLRSLVVSFQGIPRFIPNLPDDSLPRTSKYLVWLGLGLKQYLPDLV